MRGTQSRLLVEPCCCVCRASFPVASRVLLSILWSEFHHRLLSHLFWLIFLLPFCVRPFPSAGLLGSIQFHQCIIILVDSAWHLIDHPFFVSSGIWLFTWTSNCRIRILIGTQVLDDVWMLYDTQKTIQDTLAQTFGQRLYSSRRGQLKESTVEDFCSTRQVITHSLTDSSIWSNTKFFGFEKLNFLIVKLILGLLSHCSSKPAAKQNFTASVYTHLPQILVTINSYWIKISCIAIHISYTHNVAFT